MQVLFFLPSLLYGFYLAMQGDALLMVLTVLVLGIWWLPLLRLRDKSPEKLKPIQPLPPIGIFTDSSGKAVDLVRRGAVEVFEVAGEVDRQLMVSLASSLNQECWLISDFELDTDAFTSQLRADSSPEDAKRFLRDFLSRSTIPIALNLIISTLSASTIRVLVEVIRSCDSTNSFRVFSTSHLPEVAATKIAVRKVLGGYSMTCSTWNDGSEILFSDGEAFENQSDPHVAVSTKSIQEIDTKDLVSRLRSLGHKFDSN